MGALIRASSLRGFAGLVDGLGGDTAALLARYRIPQGVLEVDEALIPAVLASRLLEGAAADLACADLGLRLAERTDVSVLGPLAVAIGNAPTVGAALDCASRFLFVQSPALSVGAGPDPEGVPGVVGLIYHNEGSPSAQALDFGLGMFHRILTMVVGGGYGLRSALLTHPPLAPVSRYVAFFGADVRFGQRVAALRAPADLPARPLQGSDSLVHTLAVDYLASHFTGPDQPVTARVAAALRRSLGTPPPRIGGVARLLGMHPRTLQRHLAAEGTTFEEVLDEVRRETAQRLLTDTDLPLGQVAALTGFSEQSALTRAARRWFGAPPSRVRRTSA